VHFNVRRKRTWFGGRHILKAVDGITFSVSPGETLGVVGESGCGKSTLARAILGFVPIAAGRIALLGHELTAVDPKTLRRLRREMQIVFQDPLASLDPRMTAGQIVGEPLRTFEPSLSRRAIERRAEAMLGRVGIPPDQINRYPHELSGGQCQRIGIARALILAPRLIVCDEPVSALDVSIRGQIVNLLMDIQRDMGLALIFIAHDLRVVRHISQRIMVMYLGRLAELAGRDALYSRPRHPYTQALLAAAPNSGSAATRIRHAILFEAEPPSPLAPPSGCAFRTRCPYAVARCAREVPLPRPVGENLVACHRAEEIAASSTPAR
jgi:oligopeptide transport system ATP-binding protein